MDTSIDYSTLLDDTEQDVSKSHSKLLEAISQLDKGQRVKKAERSEPTLEVSEFHLVKSGVSDNDTVQVHDLAKALGKKGYHLEITKNLQAAKRKIHVLPKPLEKPAADRIKRIVGFENTKQELKKWNAIISKNRVAESLHFPLNQSLVHFKQPKEFAKRFRLQSDLEKELAALEPQKENIEEKEDKFALTLQEAIMKRKEAARIRAQQSYKEAKARRQNKIKSKKFHRVQRKEKIKLQLKEFEQLQKTNPEAALEKLEQLDKTRAEERMSLRHKNTGKWAKSKQIRAKYDKETQQELAQQLAISKELTQKLKKSSDNEDEENESEDELVQPSTTDKENPWMGNAKTESEIDEFVKSYRKYWDEQNNQAKNNENNVNTCNGTTENKQTARMIKDARFHDVDINSLKYQRNEEKSERMDFRKEINSLPSSKHSISKADNAALNEESSELDNQQENLPTTIFNVDDVKNNSYNKTEVRQKIKLNVDKKSNRKIKLHESDLKTVTATSTWNVESIENTAVKTVINSLKPDTPSNEKINKIFDFMEEKIQEQIKSKLERVNKIYENNHLESKKKRKNKRAEFEEDVFDGLEMETKKQKSVLDVGLNEGVNESHLDFSNEVKKAKSITLDESLSMQNDKSNASRMEIDPNKYINIKPKHLNTGMPDDITGGDDVLDDSEGEEEENRRNIVSEAFADDDVIEEFRKEKEEVVKKSQPEDIDLTLPGWGSWGGKDIEVSKRKKKRFILKVPKDLPRKDENKGGVIIFEQDKPKIREHQVNELPYPFSSVKDYEASIRMPIGRNFVPENAHRKLIEPTVKTRMGKIIEPMNEDVLVKKEEGNRRKVLPKKRNTVIKKRKAKSVVQK